MIIHIIIKKKKFIYYWFNFAMQAIKCVVVGDGYVSFIMFLKWYKLYKK